MFMIHIHRYHPAGSIKVGDVFISIERCRCGASRPLGVGRII